VKRLIPFILLAACLWLLFGGKLPEWNVLTPTKPTAVTYVYEKDNGSAPPPILAALDKLNRQGIFATPFEDDTLDGDGDVPDQYKVPLEAAHKEGLPSLVVTAGDKVLRVVKSPTTEEQVLEAAQ
jgi:hypothetical protein